MTILKTNSVTYLSEPKLVLKMNFHGYFCFFLTTPMVIFWEAGLLGTQMSKMSLRRKILGVDYHSASNLRTHRDKCFVG